LDFNNVVEKVRAIMNAEAGRVLNAHVQDCFPIAEIQERIRRMVQAERRHHRVVSKHK
jgi:hypothetical protein